MAGSDPFQACFLRVDLGRQYLDALEESLNTAHATGPYTITFHDADKPGYRVMKIGEVDTDLVTYAALRAGVVVHLLRSALDSFAYIVSGGDNLPVEERRRVDFPIGCRQHATDVHRWQGTVRKSTPNAPQAVWTALYGLEVYEGGNDEYVWALDHLNNADKHRLPIILAGNMMPLYAPLAAWAPWYRDVADSENFGPDGTISIKTGSLDPESAGFPLGPDAVIRVYPVGAYDETIQPEIPVEIVFGEPSTIRGDSIVWLLRDYAKLVENLLLRLARIARPLL